MEGNLKDKKSSAEEAGAGQSEQNSWSEFTQDTTCHGVRFIFSQGSQIWRRVLWAFIVLFSLTFFIAQVTTRTLDYLKYETTTAIDIEYYKSLPFPAVTMCNQNSIRISKAKEYGIYEYTNQYFEVGLEMILKRKGDWTKGNSLPLEMKNKNSRNFIMMTDHTIKDMIEICKWEDKNCNYTEHFTPTISENGLCYTFNHGDLKLQTKSRGRDRLRMVLNVETYEHMKGLNDDSGLKIFVHSPGDKALTLSKGITLSAGKYVRIGISRHDTVQLPPPYGICSTNATQSIDSCLTVCKSRIQNNHCGCQGPFDATYHDKTYDACNSSDLFDCILPENEGVDHLKEECHCETPCYSIDYYHKLSQSDLSSFNIERVVLHHDEEGERAAFLRNKFLTSQEARQRLDKTMADTNRKRDTGFLEEFSNLQQSLSNATERLQAGTLLHSIENMKKGVKEDRIYLNTTLMVLWYNFASQMIEITTSISDIRNMILSFDTFTAIKSDPTNNSTSLEEEILQLCGTQQDPFRDRLGNVVDLFQAPQTNAGTSVGIRNTNTDSSGAGGINSPPLGTEDTLTETTDLANMESLSSIMQWYDEEMSTSAHSRNKRSIPEVNMSSDGNANHDTGQCHDLITIMESVNFPETIFDALAYTQLAPGRYMNMTNTYFEKSELETVSQHKICYQALLRYETYWSEFYEVFKVLKANFSNEINKDFILTFVNNVVRISKQNSSLDATDALIRYNCFWLPKYININTMEQILEMLYIVEDLFNLVDGTRAELTTKMITFSNDFMKGLPLTKLVNITKMHQIKQIERLSQAELFSDDTSVRNLEVMLENSEEFKRLSNQFLSQYNQILYYIKGVVDKLNSTGLSILSENTQIFKAWREMHGITKQGDQAANNYETLITIIDAVLDGNLGAEKKTSILPVRDSLKEFLKYAKELETSSRKYVEQCAFNELHFMKNFLMVEIFFEELKVTVTSQKEAFGLLSLLGEIGGFLGLLLGASVLTVFELIDFVFMKSKSAAAWRS